MASLEQAEAAKRELGIVLPSPLRDDDVLIKQVEFRFETASNIAVIHSQSLPPIFGVVIMVGAKVTEVRYADFIRYRRHATREIHIKGEEYFLLNQADIECIIEPPVDTGAHEQESEELLYMM